MRRRFAFFGLSVCFLGCNAILGIEGGEFDPPPTEAGAEEAGVVEAGGTDARTDGNAISETGAPDVATRDADAGTVDADADAPDADADVPDVEVDADGGCGDLQNDPRNCGTCGHDCVGGLCQIGVCRQFTVAMEALDDELGAITLSPTQIIFANHTTGEIRRAAKDGTGTTETIYAAPSAPPEGFGVEIGWKNGFVYFVDTSAGIDKTQIVRCPDTGCTDVETVLAPLDGAATVLMTSDGIVTADTSTTARVIRCHQLPCEASPELVAENVDRPNRLAVNGNVVAWTLLSPQTVNVRVGAQDPVPVASTAGIFSVALTQQEAVFAILSNAVRAVPFAGGQSRDVAVAGFVDRLFIAEDTTLFFSSDDDTIKSVALTPAGSATKTVATNQHGPRSLVADDKAVYWVNTANGTVVGIAR